MCPGLACCRHLARLHIGDLLDDAVADLRRVLIESCAPLKDVTCVSWHWRDCVLRAIPITSVTVSTSDEIKDVAASYPNLRHLTVRGHMSPGDVGPAKFPPSLTRIDLLFPVSSAFATAFVRHLGALGPAGLPHLAHVVLPDGDVDITPLTVFAGTLTALRLHPRPEVAERSDAIGAALGRLVGLTELDVGCFATPRCLFEGRHKQLRSLRVGSVEDSSGERSFAALVKACPALGQVMCRHVPATFPAGWCRDGFIGEDAVLARYSFRRSRR
jgi:hypothetical protein